MSGFHDRSSGFEFLWGRAFQEHNPHSAIMQMVGGKGFGWKGYGAVMELTFLGTGAGVPSKLRNVTSIAAHLDHNHPSWWLFDAGEGTQHQLMRASISPARITRVFLTHMHGDHLFGLPGFLASRSIQSGATPLSLWGPSGLAAYVESALRLSSTHLTYELTIHEVHEGMLFHDEGFTVTATLLDHVVPSYGYRLDQDERPGELNVARLLELGIQPGREFGQLKAGQEVVFPDGRYVNGQEFLGPARPGRTVVVTCDTKPTERTVELARGADLLVHEATYAHTEAAMAPKYYHSTGVDAARIASQAGVKTLLLTHFSQRYTDSDLEQLQTEARAVFPNTHVMHDLQTFPVPLPQ